MIRRFAAAVLAAAALLALCAGPASAAVRACPREKGFVCTTLSVPLDRGGQLTGTLSLHYALQARKRKGLLLALTGGPGQNGIPFGPGFADELKPALRDHRLLVLDQRGTGRSNVLSCPEVQGLGGLQAAYPETAASCARRLGPQRDHYSTIDTVDDIEAIRRRLGVDKIAIYGVSYGTWVAQQYARRYPAHVERLILDSVVAPAADPYDLRSVQALPRVLRGLCAHGACAGITRDTRADLAAVVAAMQRAGGSLHGVIRDGEGGRRTVAFSQFDLLETLVSSDLNPWLRLRLPAALAAARDGDPIPLLRMRRDVAGGPLALGDLSVGLFFATTCADAPLPYAQSSPLAQRPALAAAALAALPAAEIAPFSRETIDRSSAAQICMQWPPSTPAAPLMSPLPNVPALILSGRDDVRTPLEGARAVAAELPRAELVSVTGVGHDVLGSDATGCARRALRTFSAGKRVGSPCRGRDGNVIGVAPVPPRSLADVAPIAGIPGRRGRVAAAALATIGDARTTTNESYYAGFDDAGAGGLRSGRFEIIPTGVGELFIFHGDVYVPGVSLHGTIYSAKGRFTGTISVRAGRDSGRLRLRGGRLTGTLGGVRVSAAGPSLLRGRLG
ncbi:MAG TPA: alpha/beta fold hydrolase [Solirubrobacteraceae bacterium]|nr:alpha/beta fold hydrolase [Solirubrobacteraceae bacterium]